MATPLLQNETQPLEEAAPIEPAVRDISGDIPLSIDDRAAILSPARRMQETLGREFAEIEDEKWSTRRTIAFIALSCGAFWTFVYFMVAAAIG